MFVLGDGKNCKKRSSVTKDPDPTKFMMKYRMMKGQVICVALGLKTEKHKLFYIRALASKFYRASPVFVHEIAQLTCPRLWLLSCQAYDYSLSFSGQKVV